MIFINKTLDRLHAMLDKAIAGESIETIFDESKVSSIESKLHKYLLATGKHKEQLTEQKLKLDTLISDISHQTKTPLSNISLYSELLAECENEDDRQKYSELLMSQSEKLNFLITSLVKASRLENGIITLTPKNQNIDLLLSRIAKTFPKVEITMSESAAIYDLKWTTEAILNIIDNAYKYGANKVWISVSVYQMFLKIDIKDNGIGIKEEEIPKIFARFYRGVNSENIDGVGIGLYLSREIITKQNGYIKVSSKIGEGSLFSVFLPI